MNINWPRLVFWSLLAGALLAFGLSLMPDYQPAGVGLEAVVWTR